VACQEQENKNLSKAEKSESENPISPLDRSKGPRRSNSVQELKINNCNDKTQNQYQKIISKYEIKTETELLEALKKLTEIIKSFAKSDKAVISEYLLLQNLTEAVNNCLRDPTIECGSDRAYLSQLINTNLAPIAASEVNLQKSHTVNNALNALITARTLIRGKNNISVPQVKQAKILLTANINHENDRITRVLQLIKLNHITPNWRECIEDIIKKYNDRFFVKGDTLGATNLIEHEINTTSEVPIRLRQFRHPPQINKYINDQMQELLEKGIIEKSTSAYCAPVFCVPKKNTEDGEPQPPRIVFDYRALNKVIPDYNFPVPLAIDLFEKMAGAQLFSSFDMYSSYHQISIKKEHRHKTAFQCEAGLFQFCRTPFGLKTSAPVFLSLVNILVSGLKNVVAFFDDICVYSKTFDEHCETISSLMERLREANLVLQPKKCKILRLEIEYLGHIISKDGIRPCNDKLRAVKEFPIPRTPKNVKQWLGLAGYYRRFIENFAKIAKPLTNLLKKGQPFEWGDEQQTAFETLRDKLCEPPILKHPDFDKTFYLTTDA